MSTNAATSRVDKGSDSKYVLLIIPTYSEKRNISENIYYNGRNLILKNTKLGILATS